MEELINKGVHWAMYDKDGISLLSKLYFETFGVEVDCTNCPSVLYKAFFKLKNSKNKVMQITKKPAYKQGEAFQLKKGINFYFKASDGKTYRCTDKLPMNDLAAIEYIKQHDSHITHFVSVNSEVMDKEFKAEPVVEQVEEATNEVAEVSEPKKRGRKAKVD